MRSPLAALLDEIITFCRSSEEAAHCVARHGVRSHPVPVALVGELHPVV